MNPALHAKTGTGTPTLVGKYKMQDKEHKGWFSRGYLPHFDSPGVIQMIGFRLADSLPQHVLKRISEDPELYKSPELQEFIEESLAKGYGECYLAKDEIAQVVKDTLLAKDGQEYRLISWVIMPNHVHILIEIINGFSLPDIVKWIKGSSAFKANKLLGRNGAFWYRDYFDRYIRNESHYYNAIEYIHMNPVKAGLVDKPGKWRFSSAWEEPTEPTEPTEVGAPEVGAPEVGAPEVGAPEGGAPEVGAPGGGAPEGAPGSDQNGASTGDPKEVSHNGNHESRTS